MFFLPPQLVFKHFFYTVYLHNFPYMSNLDLTVYEECNKGKIFIFILVDWTHLLSLHIYIYIGNRCSMSLI